MGTAQEDLDVGSHIALAGAALERHVLRSIHDAGHPGIRTVHGYVFQRLLAGPVTVGDLAASLQVTQQRASKLVLDLEAAGYVRRDPRAGDARVRDVVMTEAGHEVVALARRTRADLEAALRSRTGDLGAVRAALDVVLELTGGLEAVRHRRVPVPPEVS
jgi:DNA-binding MarR family transcriptional regulator